VAASRDGGGSGMHVLVQLLLHLQGACAHEVPLLNCFMMRACIAVEEQ
jgi:hypothetical protein